MERYGMSLLVKDLELLDELVSGCYRGTNCSIHLGRILSRAEAGYYHVASDRED